MSEVKVLSEWTDGTCDHRITYDGMNGHRAEIKRCHEARWMKAQDVMPLMWRILALTQASSVVEREAWTAAEKENAFRQGVEWALKELGWHPNKAFDLYEEISNLLDMAVDDMSICRMEPWDDPGDSSVGIDGSCGVGLSDDQSGTVLEALVIAARSRPLSEPSPDPCWDVLMAEFRKLKSEISCRIEHGADSNGHLEGIWELFFKDPLPATPIEVKNHERL